MHRCSTETFSRMHLDLLHEHYLVMRCDRCGLDFAIAFDDAEDSHIVVGGGLDTIPLRSWGPHKTHFCSILNLPIVYTGSSLPRARPTNCSSSEGESSNLGT